MNDDKRVQNESLRTEALLANIFPTKDRRNARPNNNNKPSATQEKPITTITTSTVKDGQEPAQGIAPLLMLATIISPTMVVVFKWKDAFLCLLRDYLQAFLPGIESELPGGWTRKTEDDHGPGSSKGYVIWNDRNGVLKLVQVDKLKEAWKKCKPRAAFISANNEPGLFQKVFLSLLTAPPTGPQYNIVGVLDSHSTSTNRLEAILINDYRLRIPHNYPTDNNTAPAPTTVQAEAQQTHSLEEKADDQKMDEAADAESLLKKTTAEPDAVMAQESRGQKTKRSGDEVGARDAGFVEPEPSKRKKPIEKI